MAAPTVFNPATGMLVHAAAIADPSGGATIDAQARTAVTAILVALRAHGVIAGASQLPLSHTWNGTTSQAVLSAAIADPSGGATIDANARAAIGSMLAALRNAGVIAGGSTSPSAVGLMWDEDTNQWAVATAIGDVSGGATIDAECRTAVNAALAAMRKRQLIAQD